MVADNGSCSLVSVSKTSLRPQKFVDPKIQDYDSNVYFQTAVKNIG
jgi:hypothetical protein